VTTIPAYEREPYRRELDVRILEVGESDGRPWARLDDTILYPEGGGQPSDQGELDGVRVVEVESSGRGLLHHLAAAVAEGPARLALDWPRRYDHMQQHTAQHLLSCLALGRFGWSTRSFHIGPAACDIELDVPPPEPCELAALEAAAVAEVRAARAIRARRVKADEYESLEVRSRGLPAGHTGSIRLVEIDGLDLNTCGGTHLASTAEVETVKLLRAEPLRGGCRLYWLAGGRVRRRLAEHEERGAGLRSLFDAGDDDLAAVAALKLEQLTAARRRARSLEERLARAVADRLAAAPGGVLCEHFEDSKLGFLQSVGRELASRAPGRVALLTAEAGPERCFALVTGARSGLDAGVVGPRVAELLEGRGGGAGAIFQGKAESLAEVEGVRAMLAAEVERCRRG